MARAEYTDIAVNGEGRPVAGAKVLISVHPGSAGSSTLWAGETGEGTVSNLKSGKNGLYAVWLTEGRYDVSIPHFQITKTVDVINQASVGTGGGGEIGEEAVTEPKIHKEAVSKEKLAKGVQEEIQKAKEEGGLPTGAAGGDLTGTYPNPTVGLEKITKPKLSAGVQAELAAKGAAESFSIKLGDGVTTTFVVNHKLATVGVVTNVFKTTTPFEEVSQIGAFCSVRVTDTEHVTVVFNSAPATNAYTLAVAAGGVTGKEGPAGPTGPAGAAGPPGELTGAAGGDLTGSYPNPTVGNEKLKTEAYKNASITKEKLSAGVQTELGEKTSAVVVKEFVDINNFFNAKGEKKGITATEAGELVGGKHRDAAPIIQEAIEKAQSYGVAYKGGPKGTVSASEPGKYYLESTRLSANPTPYPVLKSPYKGSTFNACLHLYNGVSLQGASNNAAALQLEVGTQVVKKCEEERLIEPNYSCVAIGVEPQTGGVAQLVLGAFTLSCSAALNPWVNSKTPPPLPDGIFAGAQGRYVGLKIEGGFRYGFVNGANHFVTESIVHGGWARLAQTNWASSGARTGNTEMYHCTYQGGFTAWYVESECTIASIRMTGGWFGFGTAGPLFYKPVTGSKKTFIGGLKMYNVQFEGGRGPLFYNEDGLGKISKVVAENCQVISGDSPMSSPGPSDIGIGAPLGGLEAFIKGGRINQCYVNGGLLANAGWGSGAAGIIATESCEENNWGDCTEVINQCRYRNIQMIKSPKHNNNYGTYTATDGMTSQVAIGLAAGEAIKEGEVLRNIASPDSTESTLAVAPYNKASATVAGVALLPASPKQSVPVARKSAVRPTTAKVSIAKLGAGRNGSGVIPPPARGGTLKLTAALLNGAETGAAHEPPIVLTGAQQHRGAIFVSTLSDIPTTAGVLSTGPGIMVYYRQGIAAGTETTVKAVLTKSSKELTGVKVGGISSVKGIAPMAKITGTGIPTNTEIEIVDGEGFKLQLTNAATVTGEQTLTVVVPIPTFEGTLYDNSTRSTEVIKLGSLVGTQTIKVISTAGMESAGTVQVTNQPCARIVPKFAITYASKTETELKGCKTTGGSSAELPAGSIVAPLTTPKVQPRAKLYRAAEIEATANPTTTYEGTEFAIKSTTTELTVLDGEALPTSGRAVISIETTLPEAVVFTQSMTKLKVTSTAGFPKEPVVEGEVLGRLEIGTVGVFRYTAVANATEFTGTLTCPKAHLSRLANETVVLESPPEVVYSSRNKTTLKGVQLASSGSHPVAKGMLVTGLVLSTSGGVFEGSSVKYGYRSQSEARGKRYLSGVSTPGGGGELASGTTLTDLTVLEVKGAGFPSGPASAVVVTGALETQFSYSSFVSVSGSEVIEPEEETEPEPEPEEEGGEPSVESVPGGYFIGVVKTEGSGGQAGFYTGGTQLDEAEVKLTESPAEIKVLSTTGFGSKGVIKMGKYKGVYTSITATTFKGLTWTGSGTSVYKKEAAVTPFPGQTITSDSVVKVAYGNSGRTGTGDIGVVTEGGEGPTVGTSVEGDLGGSVVVEF